MKVGYRLKGNNVERKEFYILIIVFSDVILFWFFGNFDDFFEICKFLIFMCLESVNYG